MGTTVKFHLIKKMFSLKLPSSASIQIHKLDLFKTIE